MKHTSSVIVFIGVLWLAACQTETKKKNENNTIDQTFLQTEQKEVFVSLNNCKESDSACTYFKVNYPEIISPDSKAMKKINRNLHAKLLTLLKGFGSGTGTETSLQDIGSEFVDDYDAFINEFPESAQTWMVETTVSKTYESKDIVTFRIDVESYTGGAHGNYLTRYLNFSMQNGSRIKLTDVFADTVQLKQALLTALRKQNSLNEETDLEEAGFYLDNGEVPISDNFGFTKNGFIFHFDPYIIAPFSMGAIEIEIPGNAVKQKKIKSAENPST